MTRPEIDKEVFDLLSQAKPIKPDRGSAIRTALIMIAVMALAGFAWIAYVNWKAPKGKITSPAEGATASHVVEIEGYTKNLPLNRRFVWLTVDVPGIGLCWPKRPIYQCNSEFRTKIMEEGPNQTFIVSLYAVDQTYHADIMEWFEECRLTQAEPGFPMLPTDYQLDTLKLNLEKT